MDCVLLLIILLSQQSLESQRENSTPTLAFSLLGFWVSESYFHTSCCAHELPTQVAYVGARAATRLNLALARGYLYGQVPELHICEIEPSERCSRV